MMAKKNPSQRNNERIKQKRKITSVHLASNLGVVNHGIPNDRVDDVLVVVRVGG